MGIVNLTPDSFSDGGRLGDPQTAVAHALSLVREGADVLDLGAESSRPGSDPVSSEEELDRLLPVLEALRPETDVPISIDTTKASVARAALERGADWINDISALRFDPEMAAVVADSNASVVLMHIRGRPKTMQDAPQYDDPVAELQAELAERVEAAIAAGIEPERIVIDPGIGFGKRLEDNLALLRELEALTDSPYPLLLGASRKSFLGRVLADESGVSRPVEGREIASMAVLARGFAAGVSVHRVHAVRYAKDMLRTLASICRN